MIDTRSAAAPFRALPAWLADEVADWGVTRTVAMVLLLGPVVLAGFVAVTVVYRPLYSLLVEEDAVIEWLQVGVLAGLLVAGLLVARRLLGARQRVPALVFLVGVAGTAFILGEEISWGQRIFGWATPAELETLNRQGETNIHNIGSVLMVFNLGMMTIAGIAAFGPLVWRLQAGSRPRQGWEILFVPPLFLASAFLIAFGYRFIRFTLVPEGRFVVTHYQEVTELLFYVAALAFLVLVYRRLRGEPETSLRP